MNRKEMKQLLEERFERIALLETRIDTMEQLIDGYHAREQSLIDTLHTAQNTAKHLVEEARAEAGAIREQARRDAESLLGETQQTVQSTVSQAEREARELRATARSETDRVLRDAEIIKREYEELVTSFNAMLEQNANELRETAARFAEFIKGRKIETPDVRLDGEAFYKSVGAMNDANLPDPDGDPAALMRNIYLLQKRPMPTAEDAAAEEVAETADPAAEPAEEQTHPEPFSEHAWASERQQSASEPQAEFTQAFDPAFNPSDVSLYTGECATRAEEAEHAFDEYFYAQESSAVPETSFAATEPYSRAAWETQQHRSESEPQAEAEQAFDAFFTGAVEPSGKTAQDEVSPEQAAGPEGAAPEPYSEKAWAQGAFTSDHEPQAEGSLAFDAMFGEPEAAAEPVSYEGVRIEEPTPLASASSAPEPYSEMAWAQGAFTSNHEPQAEGSLAFDAMFAENDAAEEPVRAFEAEQEPREWEPEREPDADEIPTVSRYVSGGDEEEVSLDALLEEIIKAGE